MKKRKKRSTIKFLKILITLYLCVIAMPFTFLTTLAKYTSTVSASGTVGIARPVLNLQTKPVTNTVNPVNSMEVNFSVVNFENGVVNEVKLDYTISFVIDEIYDESMNPIGVARHPEEVLNIKLDTDIEIGSYSMIRLKVNNNE